MPSAKKPRERFRADLSSVSKESDYAKILKKIAHPTEDQPEIGKDQDLSLPVSGSLPESEPQAYQTGSLPETSSLPITDSLPKTGRLNLWAAIEPVRGHTRVHNAILDQVYGQLEPSEQAVYTQLYRLSHGYGKDTCIIGLPRLAKRANIGKSTAQLVIEKLIRKGLIEKLSWNIGKGKEQGTQYRVPIPDSLLDSDRLPKTGRLPESATNKDLKEKVKKNRRQLEQIIARVRQIHVGQANYTIADLAEDVKRACAREGVVFDNDLFNEIT